jgi:hypothetical protein
LPPRKPTIASGATPIGSVGRAPDERKEEGKKFLQVIKRIDKAKSKYF